MSSQERQCLHVRQRKILGVPFGRIECDLERPTQYENCMYGGGFCNLKPPVTKEQPNKKTPENPQVS